jgi:hypothetical protein
MSLGGGVKNTPFCSAAYNHDREISKSAWCCRRSARTSIQSANCGVSPLNPNLSQTTPSSRFICSRSACSPYGRMPNAGTAIARARTMAVMAATVANQRYPLEKAVICMSTPLCCSRPSHLAGCRCRRFPNRGAPRRIWRVSEA